MILNINIFSYLNYIQILWPTFCVTIIVVWRFLQGLEERKEKIEVFVFEFYVYGWVRTVNLKPDPAKRYLLNILRTGLRFTEMESGKSNTKSTKKTFFAKTGNIFRKTEPYRRVRLLLFLIRDYGPWTVTPVLKFTVFSQNTVKLTVKSEKQIPSNHNKK